jgi:hypothetical protein
MQPSDPLIVMNTFRNDSVRDWPPIDEFTTVPIAIGFP